MSILFESGPIRHACLCIVCTRLVKKNQRSMLCNKYIHKCCSDTVKQFRNRDGPSFYQWTPHPTFQSLWRWKKNFNFRYLYVMETVWWWELYEKPLRKLKFNRLVKSNLFESNDCNDNTKYYTLIKLKR